MVEMIAIIVLVVLSTLVVFEKREPVPPRACNRATETPNAALRAEAAAREAEAAARFEREFVRRYREEVAGS